ncbi:hypothetical protein [Bradyrhizobium sp. P5_C11_2]
MSKLTVTAEVLDTLRRLGRIAATMQETAEFFDVTEGRLSVFLASHPQARAAFDAERVGAKVSRQRRQFRSDAPADMIATGIRFGMLSKEPRR